MVEIMRKERGVPFEKAADFTGPYPSGDTCILLDVAARLGKKCCFLGVAGDDLFSDIVLTRLGSDGIDTKYVRKATGYPTATVFVRYEKDGKRQYLDLVNQSACTQLREEDIHPEAVGNAKWIHVSGEILSICRDGEGRKAVLQLLESIPEDSKLSLDPNFTTDLPNLVEIMEPFVKRADLIMPSEGEAEKLTGASSDEEACRILAKAGKIIALKKGKAGCEIYFEEECILIPPYYIEEIDPTGCGDSFCAGLLCGLIDGKELFEAGAFANAVGALQAASFGPMEGARRLHEVEEFMKRSEGTKPYGN